MTGFTWFTHTHTYLKYEVGVWVFIWGVKPWEPSSQTQFRHLCMFVIFQINIPECYNKETKESFKRSNLKARQRCLPNVKASEMKAGWREGDGSRQGSFSCDGVSDWMWRLRQTWHLHLFLSFFGLLFHLSTPLHLWPFLPALHTNTVLLFSLLISQQSLQYLLFKFRVWWI